LEAKNATRGGGNSQNGDRPWEERKKFEENSSNTIRAKAKNWLTKVTLEAGGEEKVIIDVENR